MNNRSKGNATFPMLLHKEYGIELTLHFHPSFPVIFFPFAAGWVFPSGGQGPAGAEQEERQEKHRQPRERPQFCEGLYHHTRSLSGESVQLGCHPEETRKRSKSCELGWRLLGDIYQCENNKTDNDLKRVIIKLYQRGYKSWIQKLFHFSTISDSLLQFVTGRGGSQAVLRTFEQ